MPTGIPSASSANQVAPLSVRRIKRAPLERIGIFRSLAMREDKETGEKYEIEQVNLSLDWNSGHIQRNADGEPVLDKDGNEQIHYINDGFVTLTGDRRGNLIKILRALGFDGPNYLTEEGDLDAEVELVFGENALGHDYSGVDYDELPFYVLRSKGGKHNKRDVEVPVLSFTINGEEVIGRACELVITEKNGWNRVESYVPLENPEEVKPQARTAAPPSTAETVGDLEEEFPEDPPFLTEPDATEKHAIYVQKALASANVPREEWTPVIRYMLSMPTLKTTSEISLEGAKTFRAMFKEDPTIIKSAYDALHPEDAAAEEDDEFDLDEQF